MFELTVYEVRRRLRGAFVLSGLVALLGVFTVAFFPSVEESSAELEVYIESLPPAMRNAFGIESFSTIEGFLATEFYQFGWVILLGIYFAYRAGSLVAGDVEDHSIDLWLATPLSRGRLVVERYLAVVPTILLVNLVSYLVVVVAISAISESVPVVDLAMVHLLSVPYLLTTAGIGLVLSVVTAKESVANRAALGLVFALFLVESLTLSTDFEWVGALSPTRYFDPTEVLLRGAYDPLGTVGLCVATITLVGIAVVLFRRVDIT